MTPYDERRAAVAQVMKAVLVCLLGGKCVGCGGTLLSVLEVDHAAPEGAGWSRRGMGSYKRVLRYFEEYKAGIPLRVLCRRCNAQDGARRGNAWWHEATDVDRPAVTDSERPAVEDFAEAE